MSRNDEMRAHDPFADMLSADGGRALLPPAPVFYSIKDLVALTGVCRSALEGEFARDGGPAETRVTPNRKVYARGAVERWLVARTRGTEVRT